MTNMSEPILLEKPTRTAILDVAQELVQCSGYNAFSYRDLSLQIGIKTSSIHYYFPAKSDLATALVQRYLERFAQSLEGIIAGTDSPACQLERFLDLVCLVFRSNGRICLAGMLATDLTSLPEAAQNQVREFFQCAEGWLQDVLMRGQQCGELRFHGDPKTVSITLFAALQGAMLSAYALGDENRMVEAANWWRTALDNTTRLD